MFIRALFLFTITYHVAWCEYDLDNVIQGTKMSVNDDMLVSASNAFANFVVILHPFRKTTDGGSKRCSVRYNTTDRFVHSVSVVGIVLRTVLMRNNSYLFLPRKECRQTLHTFVLVL